MKVKKRFMIALAGAMILGVFGTSGIPVMAAGPDFEVTIPAGLNITNEEWNKAGDITMRVDTSSQYGKITISVEPDEYEGEEIRYLDNQVFTSEKIPYELRYFVDPYYHNFSTIPIQETFWNSDPLVFPVGAYLGSDYKDGMLPGIYKDVVTFNVSFERILPSA